jgi:hypothetical protein
MSLRRASASALAATATYFFFCGIFFSSSNSSSKGLDFGGDGETPLKIALQALLRRCY